MMDITPSEEQKKILEKFNTGKNIIIESVAGSGKSTTLLLCAKSVPKKSCLILTYNKDLRFDTEKRIKRWGLSNIGVYTYHAFASLMYERTINNDEKLITALNDDTPGKIPEYDVLMLDEVQDMSDTLYRLVVRYLSELEILPQMVVVGDLRQTINFFMGSRTIFFRLTEELFIIPAHQWERLILYTTYRMPESITNFINNVVLHKELMIPYKKEEYPKPTFICYEKLSGIFDTLYDIVKKYGIDNIVFEASSVEKNKELIATANRLSKSFGVPMHVTSERTYIDSESKKLSENKLLFSTMNKMKGRERDVIVCIIDNTRHNYDEEIKRFGVPNILYVALTRAKKHLFVLHKGFDIIPIFDVKQLPKYANVYSKLQLLQQIVEIPENSSKELVPDTTYNRKIVEPSRITDYVDVRYILKAAKLIKIISKKVLCKPIPEDNIPEQIVHFDQKYSENVSDLYGSAITLFMEYKRNGKLPDHTIGILSDPKVKEHKETIYDLSPLTYNMHYDKVKSKIKEVLAKKEKTHEDIMFLTNAESIYGSYIYRITQIKDYSWVSKEYIELLCKNTQTLIGVGLDKCQTEIEVYTKFNTTRVFSGRADFIYKGIPIELKCTREQQTEHFIQAIIYSWIIHDRSNTCSAYVIYPLRGERYHISTESAGEMIDILLNNHSEDMYNDDVEELVKYNYARRFISPELYKVETVGAPLPAPTALSKIPANILWGAAPPITPCNGVTPSTTQSSDGKNPNVLPLKIETIVIDDSQDE